MRTNGEYLLLRGPENLHCEMHINPELEFVYVMQGSLKIAYDDSVAELESGEMAMVLPYRLHRFFPSEDCRAWVFMFSYNISENFYNSYRMQIVQNKKVAISDALHGYVQSLLTQDKDEMELYEIRSLYYALTAAYLKKEESASGKVEGSMVLRSVVEYITAHAMEDVTMGTICEQFGFSEARIRRALKSVNMSFGDLLASIRISYALRLLADDELNVTEIAYACGFGSIRSFNRVFAKMMQFTPSEYRKEIQGQK